MRPTLFNYIATTEEWEYYTAKLWKLMEEDDMKVKIHEIYPLKDVARAHTVSLGMIVRSIRLSGVTGSRRPKDYGQAAHDAVNENARKVVKSMK